MAKRHEHSKVEVKQQDIRQADTVIRLACVISLVTLILIKAQWPAVQIPDIVYWILGAAIIGKEAIAKLISGGKK